MVVGADAVRGDDEQHVLSGPGAVGSGNVGIADLAAGVVHPAGDLGGRGQGGSGHASILPPGVGDIPSQHPRKWCLLRFFVPYCTGKRSVVSVRVARRGEREAR